MIIDLHEKYDVSPEWFEEQAKRTDGWDQRLCELLTVYKLNDHAGAEMAAEKMKAAGFDEEMIRMAME